MWTLPHINLVFKTEHEHKQLLNMILTICICELWENIYLWTFKPCKRIYICDQWRMCERIYICDQWSMCERIYCIYEQWNSGIGYAFVSSWSLDVRGYMFVSNIILWEDIYCWEFELYEKMFICELWISVRATEPCDKIFICEQWSTVRECSFVSTESLCEDVHLWAVDHCERKFICEQWITVGEVHLWVIDYCHVRGSSFASSGSLWEDIYLENIYTLRLTGIYKSEQQRSKKGYTFMRIADRIHTCLTTYRLSNFIFSA